MPNPSDKDLYFVAVKLFLRDKRKLLITHDIFGAWDLPGGRLQVKEFSKPLTAVIKRKISEELGDQVRYQVGKPLVFFRVERLEQSLNKPVRIFAIGYQATYNGGSVQMDKYHDQMQWVDIDTFQPQKYFSGGWLSGVQEYLAMER
jgi:hypothetical protein